MAATVILDASAVIAFLDANDAHHHQAVTAFADCQTNDLVIPASVYAEVLVGPYRRGTDAVDALEQFLADFAVRIEPLSAEIAHRAACCAVGERAYGCQMLWSWQRAMS